MDRPDSALIGFACAYTPLPLIAAAGFTPYRVHPLTEAPDRAGRLLHDNICPHVKRILDRALGSDLPALAGMVFMNSCDAMRRLFDAWRTIPGGAPAVLIDLPIAADELSVRFFAGELERLARTLEAWGGRELTAERIRRGIDEYNALAGLLQALAERVDGGTLADGPARLQAAFNRAATSPFAETAAAIRELLAEPAGDGDPTPFPSISSGTSCPIPRPSGSSPPAGRGSWRPTSAAATACFRHSKSTAERISFPAWRGPSWGRNPAPAPSIPPGPPGSPTPSSRRPGRPASGGRSATR